MKTAKLVLVLVLILGTGISAWAQSVLPKEVRDFAERYALAEDREAALAELIPGTLEYYYYHCLHYQNAGELEKAEELLREWRILDKEGSAVYRILSDGKKIMEERQFLLKAGKDPSIMNAYMTFHLKEDPQLQMHFAPIRKGPEGYGYPSSFDNERIAFERIYESYSGNRPEYFTKHGMEKLVGRPGLQDVLRRRLLDSLETVDIPGLVELIATELRDPKTAGFSRIPICGKLMLGQLEELRALVPNLAADDAYVAAVAKRLAYTPDVDLASDPAAAYQSLRRLYEFARGLPPTQNSFKAAILYRMLEAGLERDECDQALLLEYLQLPREQRYIEMEWLKGMRQRGVVFADLKADFSGLTRFPPVGDDQKLVRACLEKALVDAASTAVYDQYIEKGYLERVFAETKLLYGMGDAKEWSGKLNAKELQELNERIEIDFSAVNPKVFGADERVELVLKLKNVGRMMVRVYDIDAAQWYRQSGGPLSMAMNLDGLVASHEEELDYSDIPRLRRHEEKISLPVCDRPGAYIVEAVGNGQSSRALITKGFLRMMEEITPGGHLFTIMDAEGRPCADGRLWFGGRTYEADKNGTVLIPFKTQKDVVEPMPRVVGVDKKIVAESGRIALLESFRHQSERYDLQLNLILDREQLLAGRRATALLRPRLYVSGVPTSAALIQDAVLELETTDADGIASTARKRLGKIADNAEIVHGFTVPPRTMSVRFRLRGKVRNLSQNRDDSLVAAAAMEVNGMIKANAYNQEGFLMTGRYLRRTPEGWVLDVLGRNGEPRHAEMVAIGLAHRDFKDIYKFALETDSAGRVKLGMLKDVTRLEVELKNDAKKSWDLHMEMEGSGTEVPREITLGESVPLILPGPAEPPANTRDYVSLIELVDEATPLRDRHEMAVFTANTLVVGPLPPGEYRLTFKRPFGIEGSETRIHVTAGLMTHGNRLFPTAIRRESRNIMQWVESAKLVGDKLQVSLAGLADNARLHVIGRRYSYDIVARNFVGMGRPASVRSGGAPLAAVYSESRFIGDETRYVLDRRRAGSHVGNMLERPSLLINPWSASETETGRIEVRDGERYQDIVAQPRSASTRGAMISHNGRGGAAPDGSGTITPAYDFLPRQSLVLANLDVGGGENAEIKLGDLTGYSEIEVIAVSDAGYSWRTIPLEPSELSPRDRRLVEALQGTNVVENKRVRTARAGDELEVGTDGDYRMYASLAEVFRLYQSLEHDDVLEEFAFILEWPELSEEEKLEKYGKYACHELNLLLFRRDRKFFDSVVKPVLVYKRDKDFMDRWLLEEDLSMYAAMPNLLELSTPERVLLAERIPRLRQPLVAALRQALEVEKPTLRELDALFDAAISSGALEDVPEIEEAEVAMAGTDPLMADDVPVGITFASERSEAETLAFDKVEQVRSPVIMRNVFGSTRGRQAGADGDGRASLEERAVASRERVRDKQLYRSPEKTREWVETYYYRKPRGGAGFKPLAASGFWLDRAEYDSGSGKPFVSANFMAAAETVNERLLALALLDLPFRLDGEETERKDGRIVAVGESIYFTRRIEEGAAANTESVRLGIVQSCFDYANRNRYTEGGEKVLRTVTDEFVAGRAYGARVVVSNPSELSRSVKLLLQVPEGALALGGGRETWSVPLRLEAYSSGVIEYAYYFPQPGRFSQYAPSVSENNIVLAQAEGMEFNVVAKATKFDTESWNYISRDGTSAQVLEFLKTRNIRRPEVDLAKAGWRMHDRELYTNALAVLEERQMFVPQVWAYAARHADVTRMREGIKLAAPNLIAKLGPWFDSPLYSTSEDFLRKLEHKEYWPLVNARTHKMGDKPTIANEALRGQYQSLMEYLAHKPRLDSGDRLTLAVYMLMMDRVGEAEKWLAEVETTGDEMRMQADYARAYLAFSRNRPREAVKIAKRYSGIKQSRWHGFFQDIIDQASEAAGGATVVADRDSHAQTQHSLADKAPSLALELEGSKVVATVRNITEGELLLYPLDIELLFSHRPFMDSGTAGGTAVRPAYSGKIKFAADEKPLKLELPKEFAGRNLLVEVRGGGLAERGSYTPNKLKVHRVESLGRVRVLVLDGKPAAGAYVKVYVRHRDGYTRFYKDGYTDLRGWFDYASLSTGDLDTVERFAILVLDEERGAVVLEASGIVPKI